jgi:carbonic anhydrase
MPKFALPRLAARLTWLAAVALLAGQSAAQASDGHDSHAAEPKPAAKAEPKAAAGHGEPAAKAPAKGAAAAAKPAGGQDPMDNLREKLAEKLGAQKAPDAPTPYVVRVVAKAAADEHAPSGHTTTGAAVAKLRTAKAAAGHKADAHAAHWDYVGEGGPEAWGMMKPEFAKCSSGTRQSPIDIRSGVKVDLEPIQFDYRPSSFRVVDNGHTIQVNLAGGNSIEIQGQRYDLLQFHFHRPSEERIDGRQFDMVAHLVHKSPEGKLAVVAVLLDRGTAHALIQTVWNNLPLEKGDEVAAGVQLDMNHLLPADRRYYTYMGSLTTPPCSEGVLWMVLQQPVPLGKDQIGVFSRLYPMNARPIQQAQGRLIKQSN